MSIDVSGDDRLDVVGESFYKAAIRRIAETSGPNGGARQHIAELVPEPSNPYDRNAVKVLIEGDQVGHIPREIAAIIAEPISSLTATHGAVTALAEVLGDGSGPGYGVALYLKFQMLNVVIISPDEELDDSLLIGNDAIASSSAGRQEKVVRTPTAAAADLGVSEALLEARRETVERAVERWKDDLIDLSARNRLLYVRDLQTGTLSLDDAPRAPLMELVSGKRTALSKLVPKSLPKASPVSKLTPFEDAVRRTRSITRTARAYEEERGVRTLFLACGVATWKSDRASRPPAAPLLLVPVELKSRGASQKDFDLAPLGDLEINPTLLHLLRVDFNLKIDEKALFEHADMDGAIDTPEEMKLAFDWLTEHCAQVPGWEILDRFILGNFWYAKLPMVRDLESSIDTLSSHDVAAALAGHPEARVAVISKRKTSVPSEGFVDHLSPEDEFNVLDSDSSQSLAIGRALAGEDLVLKGPPGTGKSQTIANLICGAIGSRKRVLFVAEKRAAIDAVTKRLNGAGLGDLVLDLHSGAESRKWLAAQLGISLENVRTVGSAEFAEEHRQLARVRDSLALHAEMLHRPHEPWNVSVFTAQMEVMDRGRPKVSSRLRGGDLRRVTGEELEVLIERLRDLVSLNGLSLASSGSVWSNAEIHDRETVNAVSDAINDVLDSRLGRLNRDLGSATRETGVPLPSDISQLDRTIQLWAAARHANESFGPDLFADDLQSKVETLTPLASGGLSKLAASVFSSGFRETRREIRALLTGDTSVEDSQMFEELKLAADLQGDWKEVTKSDEHPKAPGELDSISADIAGLREDLSTLERTSHREFLDKSLEEIDSEVRRLRSESSTLAVLPEIHEARSVLAASNLGGFLEELERSQELVSEAPDELRRLWWISIVDELASQVSGPSSLAAFRGERQEETIGDFRTLEHQHVASSAQRVRRAAAKSAIEAQDLFPEQAQLVRAQAKRKRGHLPVRELFLQAPDVMTALRPCWVMSPLMVSQLIPSERAHFDLVVFDEASQVRPVDALSSMIRGHQLVVAGDERQLPPTSFFDATASAEGGESGEEDSTELGDYESVLDVLMTLFETEMLRWHYRSRDERLIGFSNKEIYGGSLTTFPGAVEGDVLQHVLVSDLPKEGERRVSPLAEVDEVVRQVLEHAQARPDESLGVIALGSPHADAIEAGILLAISDRSNLEQYFSDEREERFFVKNLERVQGDERDAIILAIGYGKNPDGSLPHRFGPLNNAGGERRLNVAVTRAKRRMTVVSSFEGSDIDPSRSSQTGVLLLKAFLEYAAIGGSVEAESSAGAGSVLHRMIQETLVGAGHEVRVSPGASADRLDLAVIDPETQIPAVAIDIDGLGYAQRPSVRDRDRLRPEQLSRLDWEYVPTWCQDWYRDPNEASTRLVANVEESLVRSKSRRDARAAGEAERDTTQSIDARQPIARTHFEPRIRPPKPIFQTGGPAIGDWSMNDLVELAAWIETDGSLRTSEELQSELMVELGIRRRGSRVAAALESAVEMLRKAD